MPPTDKAVQEKVAALQSYINENLYTCSNDILKGLGEMYVCEPITFVNLHGTMPL